MSNKLYIGKLSSDTTEEKLRELFSTLGEVITADIASNITFKPNSRYGYITMKLDSDAKKAITQLNNTELDGTRIQVTEAHKIDQKGHTYYTYRRRK